MSSSLVLLLSLFGFSSFAQDVAHRPSNVIDCDDMLGRFAGHSVTFDRITDLLARHTEVRPLYVSKDPRANLIVLVSRHRESRAGLVQEIGGWLRLPTFVPGETVARVRIIPQPSLAGVREVPPGQIDALALIENIGAVKPAYWFDDEAFVSVTDRATNIRHTCRSSSVVTMGLVQSEFEYKDWAERPMRTLIDSVRLQNAGFELDAGVWRKLAGIYYVGRPHELLQD